MPVTFTESQVFVYHIRSYASVRLIKLLFNAWIVQLNCKLENLRSAMENNMFEWPWQYQFPPFFTLQPNSNTKAKQIDAWKSLILDYHKAHKQYILDITEAQTSPLFYNKTIERKLKLDMIYLLLDDLHKQGNVEWLDKQRQRCYVFWRTPEEWGKMIRKWAENSGLTNSVCTLYEITNGDNSTNEEFHGLDQGVLKKALEALENEGLAELILDDDNEGVKFF